MPREVDLNKYKSMVDVFEQSVKKFADRPAFSAVGATLTYRDLDTQSRNFAAWLQNKTDLKPGDRIAVQMPNVSQYPVVVFGAMRAGLIVVRLILDELGFAALCDGGADAFQFVSD